VGKARFFLTPVVTRAGLARTYSPASRRFEVLKRDGFVCQYCGAHPPNVLLEIDHIIPVKEGGDNDEGNLFTACLDCNRGKGAIPLSSPPKTLAEKAKEIAEREAQLLGYRDVVQARTDRIEADMWAVADA
jgi:5-methylcytosine-specific restriction endonuclease McrA